MKAPLLNNIPRPFGGHWDTYLHHHTRLELQCFFRACLKYVKCLHHNTKPELQCLFHARLKHVKMSQI